VFLEAGEAIIFNGMMMHAGYSSQPDEPFNYRYFFYLNQYRIKDMTTGGNRKCFAF
jgi:hypothetical protein